MKTVIIAEAGVNHNGSITIAKQLIEEAAKAGADYIKFQTFSAEKLVSKHAQLADYQKKNISNKDGQLDMLKKLELSLDDHYELIEHCKEFDIEFFSTAFDLDSIDLLSKFDLPLWKIPSGEITNLPYIQKIGSFQKPVILSTGMATLAEIEQALEVLEFAGTSRDQITILHCTTEYPAPVSEVNLNAMITIASAFKVKIGYSDHTEGIEIPLAAVAIGATIIEKHFTLDRSMAGPDHKASLEPADLKKMIDGIRNIELAMGDGIKRPVQSELKNKIAARKSIVAAKTIKKGDIYTHENLTSKRPGNGISPMLWDQTIGETAKRDYNADELIEP